MVNKYCIFGCSSNYYGAELVPKFKSKTNDGIKDS